MQLEEPLWRARPGPECLNAEMMSLCVEMDSLIRSLSHVVSVRHCCRIPRSCLAHGIVVVPGLISSGRFEAVSFLRL